MRKKSGKFLSVPKPCQISSYAAYWKKFLDIKATGTWSLGCSVYKDRVVMNKAGQRDQEWSSDMWRSNGKMIQVPDPKFYR